MSEASISYFLHQYWPQWTTTRFLSDLADTSGGSDRKRNKYTGFLTNPQVTLLSIRGEKVFMFQFTPAYVATDVT